jgi:hypothetical protein
VRHREENPVSGTAVVLIVLVLLVLVALGVVLSRRRRSSQLQQHFGPEYERSVAATGDRRAAEAELAERRQRREEFDVRDLRPEERDRFRDSWNEIQRGFVDDPRQSLHSADLLVAEIMRARGYPVDDDFDRRADDLSVDHPRVVQHYREARKVRDSSDEVDTERQRTAVTSYRSLIDALLGDDDGDHDGRRGEVGQDDVSGDTRTEDSRRTDDHTDDHTDGRTDDARRTDDRTDDTRRADVATDHADEAPTGRHALREEQGAAAPTTDPTGQRSPRTEEHTR